MEPSPNKLAKRVGRFIAGLEIGQGALSGERFEVLRWQRKFLRGALSDGVVESALSVARGNGKSTLISAIACAALEGPLAVPESEILVVASSHEQGGVIFRHVQRFLAEAIASKKYRSLDTVNASRLTHRKIGAMLQVKGSDPRRLHGAAPSLIICDEMAQWPPNRVDEMLAALRTAMGKIPHSRMMMIGTRPGDEQHPFSVALRDADYTQVHAARPEDPPFWRTTWARANPSLGILPDLEAAIRREAKAARRDPSLLASFRALRLNLGVSDTVVMTLLDAGLWTEIEGNAPPKGRPIWGVDLGGSAAMSAVAGFWPSTGRLETLASFPDVPNLRERGRADGVGSLYLECHRRGELITLGGRAVDLPELMRRALRRFGKPAAISCDRWRLNELHDALNAAGVPVVPVLDRGMGYRDGAEDVRTFRRACAEGAVVPVRSLLMRSAMSEARTVSDPAGNAKLSKGTEGGRRRRARDDAAAAGILAVASGTRRSTLPVAAWRSLGVAA